MSEPKCLIHFYDGTGHHCDDDGEPLLGWYWQVAGEDGKPLRDLVGPYRTAHEAEEACARAWLADDS